MCRGCRTTINAKGVNKYHCRPQPLPGLYNICQCLQTFPEFAWELAIKPLGWPPRCAMLALGACTARHIHLLLRGPVELGARSPQPPPSQHPCPFHYFIVCFVHAGLLLPLAVGSGARWMNFSRCLTLEPKTPLLQSRSSAGLAPAISLRRAPTRRPRRRSSRSRPATSASQTPWRGSGTLPLPISSDCVLRACSRRCGSGDSSGGSGRR